MLDMLDVATHGNTDTWLSENHLVFDEISKQSPLKLKTF